MGAGVAPPRRAVGIGTLGAAAASGLAAALLQRLPFELTAGQREVLDVLSDELAANRPMNRLLQGEVGSGKTIIAVLAMLQMVDAGYQCALLAPTEVLAAQHLPSINDVLGPLAMGGQLGGADSATRVALLTGSMSAAQKNQVRAEIASGQVGVVDRHPRTAAGRGGIRTTWAWSWSTSSTDSGSSNETGCAPRLLTASRHTCW